MAGHPVIFSFIEEKRLFDPAFLTGVGTSGLKKAYRARRKSRSLLFDDSLPPSLGRVYFRDRFEQKLRIRM